MATYRPLTASSSATCRSLPVVSAVSILFCGLLLLFRPLHSVDKRLGQRLNDHEQMHNNGGSVGGGSSHMISPAGGGGLLTPTNAGGGPLVLQEGGGDGSPLGGVLTSIEQQLPHHSPFPSEGGGHNEEEVEQPKKYYKGLEWTNPQGRTVSRRIVADTPFARCELHTVQSEDGSTTVDDWLWVDEVDAINVAVITSENQFVMMKQWKYGLREETLSPVGGMIETNESPFEAAKREVMEELGLGSRRTFEDMYHPLQGDKMGMLGEEEEGEKDLGQDSEEGEGGEVPPPQAEEAVEEEPSSSAGKQQQQPPPPQNGMEGNVRNLVVETTGVETTASSSTNNILLDSSTNSNGGGDGTVPPKETNDWTYLGMYRTAANRGGGYVHTYLLRNAIPVAPNGGTPAYRSTGDGETQEMVFLTRDETRKALLGGEFREVKWTAAVGLALLHMEDDEASSSAASSPKPPVSPPGTPSSSKDHQPN